MLKPLCLTRKIFSEDLVARAAKATDRVALAETKLAKTATKEETKEATKEVAKAINKEAAKAINKEARTANQVVRAANK